MLIRLLLSVAALSLLTLGAQTPAQPGITPPPPPAKKTPPKEQLEKPESPVYSGRPKIQGARDIGYTAPGVIASKGATWVGSDNLLNISKNIGVKVEIFKPQGKDIPLLEEALKARIVEAFTKNGIIPQVQSYLDQPPLPLFHLLVMVQPIEKGFCTFCEARLFEQVTLPRVILADRTFFQAITWEKQDLLVSSEEDMREEVAKLITETVSSFIDRYKYFETIKLQMK